MTDDLVTRAKTLSAMINLGERIAWGQDTAMIDELSARIEADAATIARLEGEVSVERLHAESLKGRSEHAETLLAIVTAERDEALRRRDAWKAKAEGYDAVRLALREKVGEPWPPNLSRIMWAGIAADEKKRADNAEAKVAALVRALTPFAEYMADGMDQDYNGAPLQDSEGVGWIYLTHGDFRRARAAIAAAKGGA